MIFLNPYKSTVYGRILSPSKKKQMGIVGIANLHYDFVIPVFLTPLEIDWGWSLTSKILCVLDMGIFSFFGRVNPHQYWLSPIPIGSMGMNGDLEI